MYQNLAISRGRSDVYMWLNIFQIILQISVILAFYRYGMYVMVCAYSAFMILWLLPWHHYAGRLIRYRWTDMLKDVAPFVLSAAVVMALTYVVTYPLSSIWLLITARIFLAAILYYAIMKAARVEILCECEKFILKKLKR